MREERPKFATGEGKESEILGCLAEGGPAEGVRSKAPEVPEKATGVQTKARGVPKKVTRAQRLPQGPQQRPEQRSQKMLPAVPENAHPEGKAEVCVHFLMGINVFNVIAKCATGALDDDGAKHPEVGPMWVSHRSD